MPGILGRPLHDGRALSSAACLQMMAAGFVRTMLAPLRVERVQFDVGGSRPSLRTMRVSARRRASAATLEMRRSRFRATQARVAPGPVLPRLLRATRVGLHAPPSARWPA